MTIAGRYKLVRHGLYEHSGAYTSSSAYLRGDLYYGKDGHLSIMIHFAEVPSNLKDLLAYVGSYEIADSVVKHHISLSSIAKMNSTIEERDFRIEGSLLYLSKHLPEGQFEAVWEKYEAH